MKRFTALLLALTLLMASAAPALAKEVIAGGQYVMDVNLEVPDDDESMIGCFTAMIPDGVDLEYGVRETDLFYWIDVDTDRLPEGMKVIMDMTSDYFCEWDYKDEDDATQYDCGYVMESDETDSCITYRLYREDGSPIQGANYGFEDEPDHMQDEYERYVDDACNAVGEDSRRDGRIKLIVDYNTDDLPQPGYYYSELKFSLSVNWAFNRADAEDHGYRYVIKEGYEDREADNDDTAAFDGRGWPYRDRIDHIERIGD